MLSSDIVKKIESFVHAKPRSVQEIAGHIDKNWRTADRYLDEIEKEYGTIASRVFRGGTRGALKIVYWAAVEKASHSVFQEQLEARILAGTRKEQFSAFDIYQHIKPNQKSVHIKVGKSEEEGELSSLRDLLKSAKKQLLIFSGNLSFINFKNKEIDTFKVMEEIVKSGINIKVLCRVDLVARENLERLLALNYKYGQERIEIHHREHPLRAIIVDGTLFSIKEIQEPTGRAHELAHKLFLFYDIKDTEWIEWLTRIFWHMFSSSIDAHKRLEEFNRIKLPRS